MNTLARTPVQPIVYGHTASKLAFWTLVLFAYFLSSESASATTVGSMMTASVKQGFSPVPKVVNYVAYILGATFGVIGVGRFQKHFEKPDQFPLRDAILYLIGAGFLIALPSAAQIAVNSLALNSPSGLIRSASSIGTGGGGTGLDGMMINFVNNIRNPLTYMLSALGFTLGIFFVVTGFMRLAKNGGQDGPKGSFGSGTMMRFVMGAALISFSASTEVVTRTFFGGSAPVQFNTLVFSGVPAASLASANKAVTAILVFIQLLGFIAFMRALLMFRSIADGNQGGSTAAAFTHLIGGALAINISPTLSAIQTTLGISPLATFS